MSEQNINQNPFGDNQNKEPVIGEENKRIIYIANAPEKFGELINNEIIRFFVEEQESQKPVEINQLISKIRGNVFEEEKIKKIMMRNMLSSSKILEDYYYPLCLTNIFTLIKDKKLEIGGDIRKFLEAYISITKKNIPQRIEDGVVFLRMKKDSREQLINGDNEEGNQEERKEKGPEEELEELTEEQIEKVIIDILKENQGALTKRELFLELHILKKNKFSQILYGMKQKGLINYPPGDWKKSQVTLITEQAEEEESHPEGETEINTSELKEEKQEQDRESTEAGQEETKELPTKKNEINDPVQEATIQILESGWGEESLNLNRLWSILSTYDYSGRIGLNRFTGGAYNPQFIKLISSIPGLKIDQDRKITYNREKN